MSNITQYANQYVLDLVAYQPGKPIEETARELGMAPEDIVKLASNENSLGPSPKAVQAIQQAAAGVHIYPDGASFTLRSKIAERFGVDFNQTVVGSGSQLRYVILDKNVTVQPGTKLFGAPNNPIIIKRGEHV